MSRKKILKYARKVIAKHKITYARRYSEKRKNPATPTNIEGHTIKWYCVTNADLFAKKLNKKLAKKGFGDQYVAFVMHKEVHNGVSVQVFQRQPGE